MATRKEKIKEIFSANGIDLLSSDMDTLGTAICDSLMMIADDIAEKEPYATITISRLRDVAMSIESEINEEE